MSISGAAGHQGGNPTATGGAEDTNPPPELFNHNETMKIDEIKTLRATGNRLRTLRPKFLEAISDSRCDKHGMQFGGDDRFSVFSTKVFLDCHTGYYGNSSCSTMGSIDNALASQLLNRALNKHMVLILETMADFADQLAYKLTADAEAELSKMQALIDEVKGMKLYAEGAAV